MRQRPQYLARALADAGHAVYFVDPEEPHWRRVDGVDIVPSLALVPRSGVVLYVPFAPLRELFERFDDAVVVYDIFDDLAIFAAEEEAVPADRRVDAHHDAVVERADLVLASAPVLADRHRAEAPDLVLVPNGVDVAAFAGSHPRPADMPRADPERPVVGYHGAVSYWFDVELLVEVATQLPDWRFVVVGPVLDPAVEAFGQATALPNVTHLGERPSDAMPDYVSAFDVGAIWFTVDDLTRAVVPLKMYEYLAAGVPCVSTPLPAAEDEAVVRVAADRETFVAALRSAADERDSAEFARAAAAAAARADWAERIRPALTRLEELGLRRA